jgi:hypothetical protein
MNYTFDNGNPTPPSSIGRWTPVRNGEVYCSPACGHKCTYKAFEYATAGAAALIAELGEGWMPRVWENGGWHFEATKGTARVNFDKGDGDFQAEICVDHAGKPSQQFFGFGSTPRAAMENTIEQLAEVIATLNRTKASVALEPLAIKGDVTL